MKFFARIIALALTLSLFSGVSPQLALAKSSKPTEAQVRAEVRKQLKAYKCYSKAVENSMVRCNYKESRFNPKARNGQHLGIGQFNNSWVNRKGSSSYVPPSKRFTKHDWRLNWKTSIRRMVKAYDEGGRRNMRKHWRATYW